VLLVFSWWYDLQIGSLVVVAALGVGVGLHVLKLVLYRPNVPAIVAPGQTEKLIKVEHWDFDQGRVILEEFQDKRVTIGLLQVVARAVIKDQVNFSRPALTKYSGVTQGKYLALKSEFERLNFCYTDQGNKTHLLRAGRAFLRQAQSDL